MRPTQLRIKNLGLITGDYPIPPVTLIIGLNRSGKTTLVRAFELGLTGTVYDPQWDRNLTFDELTAPEIDEMSVEIMFDTKFWIKRTFQKRVAKSGKVEVSGGLDFKGISESAINKPRQAEQELKQFLNCSRFGLQLTEIVEAKTAERRKILLGMIVGEEDERPLTEWIFSHAVEQDGLSDTEQQRLESMIPSVMDQVSDNLMILDRLYRLNKVSATELATAKTGLEATTTLIRSLGFDRAETVDTAEIPELQTFLRNTEDDITELAKLVGSSEADQKRVDQLAQDIADITDEQNQLGEVRNNADIENDIMGLSAERDEQIETLGEKYNKVTMEKGEAHAKEVTSNQEKILACHEKLTELRTRSNDVHSAIGTMRATIAKVRERHKALNKTKAKDNEVCCPLCGSDIDMKKINEILVWEIDTADEKIHDLTVQLSKMTSGRSEHSTTLAELEQERTDLVSAHKALAEEREKTLRDEILPIQDQYEVLIAPLNEQLLATETANDLIRQRIEKETELNKLQLTDMDPLLENLRAKEKDRERLGDKINKLMIAESEAKKKTELEELQFKQMGEVRCLTAIKKATGPKGIQGVLLKEKITPFIAAVNTVLHRFAPDMEFNIEFQDDRGKESCQFGFTGKVGWTLFESASNSEKSLILFAIVIAIMNQEQFTNQRIIVMDNVERFLDLGPSLMNAAQKAIDENLADCIMLAGALRDSDLEPISEQQPDIFNAMITCQKA